MKEFAAVMASVLASLGIKAFSKDEKGKSILTEEQKKKLTDKFGPKFVPIFEADLAKEQERDDVYATAQLAVEQERLKANEAMLTTELAEARSKLAAANAAEAALQKKLQDKEAEIAAMAIEPTKVEGTKIETTEAGAGDMKKKFKADMAIAYNQHYADAFAGKANADYAFGNNTDVQQLTSEFGKYIRDEKLDIIKRLLIQTDCTQYMSTIVTNKTEIQASTDVITSVLQAFVPKWTPKGKATFTPLTIKNYKCKINVGIVPSDVMESVLGYLYDENLTPAEMPIVKYILYQLVFPKLDEEREYALATGVFKAPLATTKDGDDGGDAQNALQGYLSTLCAEKIKGGTSVNFMDNTVAITKDNVISKVQDFCKMFTPVYKKRDMPIYVDPELLDLYKAAMRAKYPQIVLSDDIVVKIEDKNAHFVTIEGMRNTGCMFSTPDGNWKHLISQDPQNIKLFMQSENYTVKVFGEYWEGTGFWVADAIFAYVSSAQVDKYKTAAGITTGGGAGA